MNKYEFRANEIIPYGKPKICVKRGDVLII